MEEEREHLRQNIRDKVSRFAAQEKKFFFKWNTLSSVTDYIRNALGMLRVWYLNEKLGGKLAEVILHFHW
jgi:hypothetical protein